MVNYSQAKRSEETSGFKNEIGVIYLRNEYTIRLKIPFKTIYWCLCLKIRQFEELIIIAVI
jgi:hypothetical protein